MKWDKIERWSPIALFAAVLCIVTAASLLWPERGFSETENRFLNRKPQFSWSSLLEGTYGVDYDAYLSDQFPLRDQWVAFKTAADRLTLSQDSNGVYFAKGGYLVEKFDSVDIDAVLLGKNQERLTAFVDKYEKMLGDGHVKVMLAPSASQILTDRLPAFAAPYDQKQIYGPLMEMLGTETVLDLETILAEHKEEYIFYRTDHHWTTDGAYLAYRLWAKSMGQEPWEAESFLRERLTDDFHGTVQAKIGGGSQADEMYRWIPKEKISYQVRYDLGEERSESLYSLEALKTRDKYRVYLDGNHALTEIWADAAQGQGKRLLVVKDSFAHSFVPFAANHFEKTVMVDLRYYNGSLEKLLEEEGITDVLFLYQAVNFAGDTQLGKLER